MTIKSELDRQRLSYMAFRYDVGTGMFQGYDGSSWKYLDKLRYNGGTSLFEGWNGTAWGSIGGGLTITPIDPTFSGTLAVGKHYLLDMTTATGDVTLSLPAGTSGSNIKIMVFANTATSYRLILQADGSDTVYYNGTASGTLRVSPANYWVELGWAPSPRSYWVAENAGDLSAEITARQNADSTLQTELDLTQGSLGSAVAGSGAWTGFSGTNYLDAELTISTSLTKLDTTLYGETTARMAADSFITSKAMTELDANTDSTFTYYTRSDFAFDKNTFFGSTTGTDNILASGKIVLNATQQFISSSLQGSMMIADAPIVNAAQAKLLYNSLDAVPTVSISRDGGSSWVAAWQQSVSGKSVIADVLFPSSSNPLFDAGTPNGTQTAAFYVAEIFQPTYHMAFTAFGAYVKLASASSAGTVVGKLMAVAGGVPTTTIATSRETMVVGQDITTTSAYKVFSFANVALHPDTQYALVLYSTGMAVNLSADQVTSSPAYILGSATSANGSSWTGSGSTDLAFQIYGTGLDVQLKVVSGTASSELVGFGVEMVLDTPTTYAGDASFETRVITSTEATTGTITLTQVRFTPGTHQLHCNVSGHDFVAPSFSELGGGVVQFPVNFFSAGDTANFYVTYGLTNLSNVPVTINNMVSSNSTLGSVTIPSGYTLDKPWMDIPAGATVTGAGNIETTGVITGAGILATTGTVLSTGKAATQPSYDVVTTKKLKTEMLAEFDSPVDVNPYGADKDFKIRGVNKPNLFVSDASTSRVGFNTETPIFAVHNENTNSALSVARTSDRVIRNISITNASYGLTSSTFDILRLLDDSGTVLGTNAISGHVYLYIADRGTGGNCFTAVYSLVTVGNATSGALFTSASSTTRGSSPVASVQMVADGAGGSVKITVTTNAGFPLGIWATATFVGLLG